MEYACGVLPVDSYCSTSLGSAVVVGAAVDIHNCSATGSRFAITKILIAVKV